MREYARHGVVDGVHGYVADIRQICFLDRANYLLHENLFHSRHLTEKAHFLGVHDPHIGVRMGGHAVRNDDRTRVIQVDGRSGRDECLLRISKY